MVAIVLLGIALLIGQAGDMQTAAIYAFLPGMLLLAGGVELLKKVWYCADCGQYVGKTRRPCYRCGCNMLTTQYSGSGRTVRNR